MFNSICPCCSKQLKSHKIDSSLFFACPHCNALLTISKQTKIWSLITLSSIPLFITATIIDGNSLIDSSIDYLAIAVIFIGLVGLALSYSYTETDVSQPAQQAISAKPDKEADRSNSGRVVLYTFLQIPFGLMAITVLLSLIKDTSRNTEDYFMSIGFFIFCSTFIAVLQSLKKAPKERPTNEYKKNERVILIVLRYGTAIAGICVLLVGFL